jgi:probable phosphoglycerate mutase
MAGGASGGARLVSPADGPRPDLYVIRHGATEWSRNGRHTGTTDLPLLPEGEDQARATAQLVADHDFALVLTSPLQRARHTCELVGLSAHAEIDEDLRELDYGDYEGITTAQIRETVPDWTVWTHPCPNGETLAEAAARVDRVIARAQAADGDVAVFAHGHILRILTARWCRLDPVEGRRFVLHTATLSTLGWEHGEPAVTLWNSR